MVFLHSVQSFFGRYYSMSESASCLLESTFVIWLVSKLVFSNNHHCGKNKYSYFLLYRESSK